MPPPPLRSVFQSSLVRRLEPSFVVKLVTILCFQCKHGNPQDCVAAQSPFDLSREFTIKFCLCRSTGWHPRSSSTAAATAAAEYRLQDQAAATIDPSTKAHDPRTDSLQSIPRCSVTTGSSHSHCAPPSAGSAATAATNFCSTISVGHSGSTSAEPGVVGDCPASSSHLSAAGQQVHHASSKSGRQHVAHHHHHQHGGHKSPQSPTNCTPLCMSSAGPAQHLSPTTNSSSAYPQYQLTLPMNLVATSPPTTTSSGTSQGFTGRSSKMFGSGNGGGGKGTKSRHQSQPQISTSSCSKDKTAFIMSQLGPSAALGNHSGSGSVHAHQHSHHSSSLHPGGSSHNIRTSASFEHLKAQTYEIFAQEDYEKIEVSGQCQYVAGTNLKCTTNRDHCRIGWMSILALYIVTSSARHRAL